jgi:mxaA protein
MQAAGAEVMVERPRAFGYVVGDELEVALRASAGERIDAASLPKLGRVSRDLALRATVLDAHTLRLRYQVIGAPAEVLTIDVPGWTLTVRGVNAEPRPVLVEAFPITVSPLTPTEPVARDGLEELRPALAPPAADEAGPRLRLGLYAAIAATLSLLFAASRWGRGWLLPRRAPFARAELELRRLRDADPDAARAALRIAHRALDRRAGHVVMAPDLPAFLARHPRLADLDADLAELFRRSGAAFFAAAAPSPDTLAFVRKVCARAARQDRG